MKLKTVFCGLLVAVLASAVVQSTRAEEEKETKSETAKAKLSKADAEKIALGKVPNGTIKEGELEKEGGKWIWSFDIATPSTKDITEVNIDANTGDVVSVTKETAKDEAKEAEAEKKEKGDK